MTKNGSDTKQQEQQEQQQEEWHQQDQEREQGESDMCKTSPPDDDGKPTCTGQEPNQGRVDKIPLMEEVEQTREIGGAEAEAEVEEESQTEDDDANEATSTSDLKQEALVQMIAKEMIGSILGYSETDDADLNDEVILQRLEEQLSQRGKTAMTTSSASSPTTATATPPPTGKPPKRRKSGSKQRRKQRQGSNSKRRPRRNRGDQDQQQQQHHAPQSPSQSIFPSPTQPYDNSPEALANLYYSHISGGEELNLDTLGDVEPPPLGHNSFAAVHLHDLVDERHRASSFNSQQHGKEVEGTGVTDTSIPSELARASVESHMNRSLRSGDHLSLEEIQNFVIENIPEVLREQIPVSAWGQVFGQERLLEEGREMTRLPSKKVSSTRSINSNSSNATPIGENFVVNAEHGDDNVTFLSDLSGLSTAFPDGKHVETRRASLAREHAAAIATTLGVTSQTNNHTLLSSSPGVLPPDNFIENGIVVPATTRGVSDFADIVVPLSGTMTDSAGPSRRNSHTEISQEVNLMGDLVSDQDQHVDRAGTVSTGTTRPLSYSTKQSSSYHTSSNDSKRCVSFRHVEVRYYERIVTDNPSVQNGPAIGIGWRYYNGGSVDVDCWENGRSRIPRRSTELVLPRPTRELILQDAGCSEKDIVKMIRITTRIKNQRRQTVTNLPAARLEEAIEKARRRISRLLSFGRTKDILKY